MDVTSQLMSLATLHAGGDLTDEEFTQAKARVLGAAVPSSRSPRTPDVPSVAHMAATVGTAIGEAVVAAFGQISKPHVPTSAPEKPSVSPDNSTQSIEDRATEEPPPKRQKPRSTVQIQNSLLSFPGFKASEKLANGKWRDIKNGDVISSSASSWKTYKCRFCSKTCTSPAAIANHEKLHKGVAGGQYTLRDHLRQKGLLSSAAADAEVTKQVRFFLNDVIDMVVQNSGEPANNQPKADGRKKNRGSAHRTGRSPAFKLKLIRQVEEYSKKYPHFVRECRLLVAESHGVNRSQIDTWMRSKESIVKAAQARRTKNQVKIQDKRVGRFHKAELKTFAEFSDMRKEGRRVGPHWIKACMRRHVAREYADTPLAKAADTFGAKRGWLLRWCKRFGVGLRRKTNVKRKPIQERIGKIKRYFALFRRRLKDTLTLRGADAKYGLWKPECRWSLDQVPAGFFDPKSTYEHRGSDRVHIASNETADNHRECTLQVCIRACKIPSLPRHGQPKLGICFRGQGIRISAAEKASYHPDVLVMWDKKAWYNSVKCNEWVVLAALEFLHKKDGPHLIICDNLSGQTTPEFKRLLKKHADGTVHNLLAGCTDEVQVVDAGFGALIKRKTLDVQTEWLAVDENWKEWTGSHLSASRRRVLITQWYGEGYCRACESYDFVANFEKCGSLLTADGSDDDKIKLQGVICCHTPFILMLRLGMLCSQARQTSLSTMAMLNKM